MSDVQDMRKIRGLLQIIPSTYADVGLSHPGAEKGSKGSGDMII